MTRRSAKDRFCLDISALENLAVGSNVRLGSQHGFFAELLRGFFNKCEQQGTPYTVLADVDTKRFESEVKKIALEWLTGAMERLPKNQEVCIFLRFRLDGFRPEERPIRTQNEVAEIVGVSQSTVYRNIRAGLKNLRKDYGLNLKSRIMDLRKDILGE